tara:strand:- start:3784 stop:4881 length:1098 start_codon:yes stop_codon:yes gene_type:complete
MKIATILGTRPEIIRLSLIIERLDEACDHVLIDTGQNYDENLSEIFFRELNIRRPDYYFAVDGSFSEQLGAIACGVERALGQECPDRVLILGDTNSGLSAIVAKRLGIPVYHMEAGNRCYSDTVPEEVNRRIIDHASNVLLPYTERSRMNLLREGIEGERIFVTGNPITEVMQHYWDGITYQETLTRFGLEWGQYLLATVHRAETVDDAGRLGNVIAGLHLSAIAHKLPVICSLHPRTRVRLKQFGIPESDDHIRYIKPMGFCDFLSLEQYARCVLTDSGTAAEECCILGTPSVCLRDVTERPELLECGATTLAGTEPERIKEACQVAISHASKWSEPAKWPVPLEYRRTNVSETVVKLLLGKGP